MSFAQIDQYRQMHVVSTYGNSSIRTAPYLIPQIRFLRPSSVIDYGCGQSALPDAIKAAGVDYVYRYDPAVPAYAQRPDRVFDLLICVDVLEHVPEPELSSVLSDIRSLAHNAMLIIDTKPARQFLPNGRNAHATVRPIAWWRDLVALHFPYTEAFFSRPRDRACIKTWRTPAVWRPWLRTQSGWLEMQRRTRKRRMKRMAP